MAGETMSPEMKALVEAARAIAKGEAGRHSEAACGPGCEFAALAAALRAFDAAEVARVAVPEQPRAKPVCDSCSDTHTTYRESSGREVMCTRCPAPCRDCGAGGPYCLKTPCPCACHARPESDGWRCVGDGLWLRTVGGVELRVVEEPNVCAWGFDRGGRYIDGGFSPTFAEAKAAAERAAGLR